MNADDFSRHSGRERKLVGLEGLSGAPHIASSSAVGSNPERNSSTEFCPLFHEYQWEPPRERSPQPTDIISLFPVVIVSWRREDASSPF